MALPQILAVSSQLVLVSQEGTLLASTALESPVVDVMWGFFTGRMASLDVLLVTATELQLFVLEPVGAPVGILTVAAVALALVVVRLLRSLMLGPGSLQKKD